MQQAGNCSKYNVVNADSFSCYREWISVVCCLRCLLFVCPAGCPASYHPSVVYQSDTPILGVLCCCCYSFPTAEILLSYSWMPPCMKGKMRMLIICRLLLDMCRGTLMKWGRLSHCLLCVYFNGFSTLNTIEQNISTTGTWTPISVWETVLWDGYFSSWLSFLFLFFFWVDSPGNTNLSSSQGCCAD